MSPHGPGPPVRSADVICARAVAYIPTEQKQVIETGCQVRLLVGGQNLPARPPTSSAHGGIDG
jgi:hypothetical protein